MSNGHEMNARLNFTFRRPPVLSDKLCQTWKTKLCIIWAIIRVYLIFRFFEFCNWKNISYKSWICKENCTYSKTSTNDKTVFSNQIFPQKSLSLWSETIDLVPGIYFLYHNRTNLIGNSPGLWF